MTTSPHDLLMQPLRWCALAAITALSLSSMASAQTLDANRINISNPDDSVVMSFDDQSNADNPDFTIFVNENFFDIDTFSGIQAFKVTRLAKSHTLRLEGNGVGVGAGAATIQAPFHLLGGGVSPFPTARMLIEDIGVAGPKELLRLKNQGGLSIRLDDIDADTFFNINNVLGRFEITSNDIALPSGPVQFRIDRNSSNNLLNLIGNRIGVGTSNPVGNLHVLADGASSDLTSATIRAEVTDAFVARDRTMLELRNHGGVVMNMLDTSAPNAMPYQVRASNDRLSFQQFGGVRAGMVIFDDGAIRYVSEGSPNVTVTSNGDLNVIGKGNGGNLNVLGPVGGAGNLFVKGNIRYNGTISGPSDRNIKENFQEINTQEILAKVVGLPISRWNYIQDKSDTPHLGPMAQDFYAAFGLGDSEKHIPLMDKSGVALAAIQGLNDVVESKEKKITELTKTVTDQTDKIQELTERLERLEALVAPTKQ